jgi:hypothetical protein
MEGGTSGPIQGGTVAAATPQRVGPATARRLCRLELAPSAFRLPSVRALHGESSTGLAFSGEADPPSARSSLTVVAGVSPTPPPPVAADTVASTERAPLRTSCVCRRGNGARSSATPVRRTRRARPSILPARGSSPSKARNSRVASRVPNLTDHFLLITDRWE